LCSSGFFLFCLPELGAYDMHAKGSCTFMYSCSVFVVVDIVATQKTNLELIILAGICKFVISRS
jgi:activator of 2-hydroxyglutaryl-CoA dehydratase